MEIKDLELTPPSKEAMQFLKNFIYEHDKGLKAIKTLAEIKEIAEDTKDKFYDAIHTGGLYDRLEQIIRKINEVEDE